MIRLSSSFSPLLAISSGVSCSTFFWCSASARRSASYSFCTEAVTLVVLLLIGGPGTLDKVVFKCELRVDNVPLDMPFVVYIGLETESIPCAVANFS